MFIRCLQILVVLACLLLAGGGNAQTVVGTGADASYLILDYSSLFVAPLTFEYRYNYDSENPIDTYAMMTAIDAFDVHLSFDWVNYGSVSEPNFILNGITYNSSTATSTQWPDVGPYWQQWVSGGSGGYITQEPYDYGVWNYGSGISAPYRTLAPGSTDGFTYATVDTPPGVSPIPEPGTVALLVLSGLLGVPFFKRWQAKKTFLG